MDKGCYQYPVQKWTPEVNQFLLEHKTLPREELYALLLKEYPNIDTTLTGMKNQCSRIGAVLCNKPHGTTAQKPLYTERVKKGYVQIKVGINPSVWWSKAKWVYLETHPWEWPELDITDNFFFLDGNNRNFDPDNIVKIKMKERTVFINEGGIVPGHPELSMKNLLDAKLKIALLDRGEKLGLVRNYSLQVGRCFRQDFKDRHRAWYKKYYSNPENRKRRNAKALETYHRIKNTPEFKESRRRYRATKKLKLKEM